MTTRPTAPPVPWADPLFTFGVTGTNGKTSTVHLLAAIVQAAGEHALDVSTLGYRLDGVPLALPSSARGFMDACAQLRDAGGRFAAVECTSESLAQGYAQRWRFDLGVFTNLTADHLGSHGSWEHYLASKAQLFTHLGPGRTAVFNAADKASLLLDRAVAPDVQRRWYCAPSRGPSLGPTTDLEAAAIETSPEGTRIELKPSPWAEQLGGSLSLRMIGAVFAENALAAACAGLAAGLPVEAIVHGLHQCAPVRGRFEAVGTDPLVVIDYAHTPDALERTCDAARALTHGRLIIVFGAGGGRDTDKRGPMGAAVGQRADLAIVTTDNPRDEDPAEIAAPIIAAASTDTRAQVLAIADRAEAIAHALATARPDDVVVIAGKGHEMGQEIAGTVHPFSDHAQVQGWHKRQADRG